MESLSTESDTPINISTRNKLSGSTTNFMRSSGDDASKLQQRLSLLREEYIKLQTRLSEVERQNSILLSSSELNLNSSTSSVESNRGFVGKILKAVADLVDQEKYSDVRIRLSASSTDQKIPEIYGHKFVLATRNESWGREESNFLDWTDIPYEAGYAIIKWVYTNETPARLRNKGVVTESDTDENDSFVLTLMKNAKKFNLIELMNRCEESLIAGVQIRNCIRYYSTAEDLGAEVLKNHCSELISTHWEDFSGDDFAHMSAGLLYDMFKAKTSYPLHFAIRMRREDVVFLFLIEFSQMICAKLNEPDDKGLLPLDLALSTGQEDLALNLIEHKAKVNQLDSNGSTPLHNAIIRGDVSSALFLLKHRADINMPDKHNNAPLHLAVSCMNKNMLEVVEKLLDHCALVDAQNGDQKTALHLSIESSNASIFSVLLKHSTTAALDIKDADGFPPMWYALQKLRGDSTIEDQTQGTELASHYFASHLITAGASPNTVTLKLIVDQKNN